LGYIKEYTMDASQQSGLVIAATAKITLNKNGAWIVRSQSGSGRYTVHLGPETPKCTSHDHETRGCKCKHILAVEYAVQHERNNDGSVTEAVMVAAAKRTTYPQDWPADNEAQTNEKRLFQSLLYDLCHGLPELLNSGRGRPRLPMAALGLCIGVQGLFHGLRPHRARTRRAFQFESHKCELLYLLLAHFRQPNTRDDAHCRFRPLQSESHANGKDNICKNLTSMVFRC
jgi:hypothetical protein